MHLDHDENRIDTNNDIDSNEDLYEQAICTIEFLVSNGLNVKSAVSKTLNCVQFRNNKDLNTKISRKYKL